MSYCLASASISIKTWEILKDKRNEKGPLSELHSWAPATISQEGILALEWSKDADVLAVGGHSSVISLFDSRGSLLDTVKINTSVEEAHPRVNALVFYNKSRYLFYGGSMSFIGKYDIQEKKALTSLKGNSSIATCMAINYDESLLGVGFQDGSICIHNLIYGTMKTLQVPDKSSLSCLEFSYNKANIMCTGTENGSVQIWDLTAPTELQCTFEKVHLTTVKGVVFSPFQRFQFSTVGLDKQLMVFDINKKAIIQKYSAEHPLTCATYDSEGALLFAGTTQGKIIIFNFQTETWSPVSYTTNESHPVNFIKIQQKHENRRPQSFSGETLLSKKHKERLMLSMANIGGSEVKNSLSAYSIEDFRSTKLEKPSVEQRHNENFMDIFSPVVSRAGDNKSKLLASAKKTLNYIHSYTALDTERGTTPVNQDPMLDIFTPVNNRINNLNPENDGKKELKGPTQLFSEILTSKQQPAADTMESKKPNTSEEKKLALKNTGLILKESPSQLKKVLNADILQSFSGRSSALTSRSNSTNIEIPIKVKKDNLESSEDLSKGKANTPPSQMEGESFQTKVLESIVHDYMADLKEEICEDIRNVHLELLRQQELQKMDIDRMFQKYLLKITEPLIQENARLKEELERLRCNY